jgi:CspA family cold shock protein
MAKSIGKVKWWNPQKGYGFILMDDGKEVFAHYTGISFGGRGTRNLLDGATVKFELLDGPKGKYAGEIEEVQNA